jgi:uroporphyrinogen-III decarboxylase
LYDEGLNPSAIFAANNAIAMGVIDALERRGLRIPQDVALVSFDDFPNISRLFPFLTVVVQPAYDMGVNAAQLLLSRLDSEVGLQPRHVVLPTRLIIRHSCGSRLSDDEHPVLSLPLVKNARVEQHSIVKPLGPEERRAFSAFIPASTAFVPGGRRLASDICKSDINRLLRVLGHQEADRLPHLELWMTSKSVYEYVLEHELKYDVVDVRVGDQSIRPEDAVEFALRIGMDAVVCNFSWRPNNVFTSAPDGSERYVNGTVKSWADMDDLESPPSLAAQLSHLERYIRAAQGTGVGVIANFTSFFDSAMLAVGLSDALYMFHDNRRFLEELMDIILGHQERVIRAVCDRFSDDLALIVINDDIAHNAGLMIHPDTFREVFPHRMGRLIAPAKEHNKMVLIHTYGKIDRVLPILYEIGFEAVNPIQPESNDIFELREQWAGQLALVGNVPTTLLAYGSREEIEEKVREYAVRLAPGGGYVLSSSTSITEGIPPENFVAMTEAVHKYGRYGALGEEP